MPTGFDVDTIVPENVSTTAADFGAEMVDFDETTHDAARVYFEIDTDNTFPNPTQLNDEVDIGLFTQNNQVLKRGQDLMPDTDYFVRAQAENVVYSDDTLFSTAAKESEGFIVDVSNKDLDNAITSEIAVTPMANFDESASNLLKHPDAISNFWSLDQATQNFWNAGSFTGDSTSGFWSREIDLTGVQTLNLNIRGDLPRAELTNSHSHSIPAAVTDIDSTDDGTAYVSSADGSQPPLISVSEPDDNFYNSFFDGYTSRDEMRCVGVNTSNNTIAAGDESGYIYGVDTDGSELFRKNPFSNVASCTVDSNDNLYYGSSNGDVNSYDRSGNTNWATGVFGATTNDLEAGSDFVVTTDFEGNIKCLNTSDGSTRWSKSYSETIWGLDVSPNDEIYAVLNGGTVYKYDPVSGNEVWSTNVSGTFRDIAADKDGFVYATNTGNDIFKIDPEGNVLYDIAAGVNTDNIDVSGLYELHAGGFNEAVNVFEQPISGPDLVIKNESEDFNFSSQINNSDYSEESFDVSNLSGFKTIILGFSGDISPDGYAQGLGTGLSGSGNSLYVYSDAGSEGSASTNAEFSDITLS